MADEVRYRYRVTSTWGEVPDAIADIEGDPEGFLLYKEDRGEWSDQALHRDSQGIVGGWDLEYVGECLVDTVTRKVVAP